MTPFGALLVLAVLQGLTEYLPVSSSGHLVLARQFLPGGEELPTGAVIEIVLHLGTLFAVLIYYRTMVLDLLRSFWGGSGDPQGDVDFSGTVDVRDIIELFKAWGSCSDI